MLFAFSVSLRPPRHGGPPTFQDMCCFAPKMRTPLHSSSSSLCSWATWEVVDVKLKWSELKSGLQAHPTQGQGGVGSSLSLPGTLSFYKASDSLRTFDNAAPCPSLLHDVVETILESSKLGFGLHSITYQFMTQLLEALVSTQVKWVRIPAL